MCISNHRLIRSVVVGLGLLGVLASCSSDSQQNENEEEALLGIWQVEDIGGRGIVDNSPATLEFHADGSVNGNASCNSYGGTYSLGAQRQLSTSELISTRRACVEALMDQEQRFFEALGNARSWRIMQPEGLLALADDAGATLILASRRESTETAGRMFAFRCEGGESFTVYYGLYEGEGQRISLGEDELMFSDDQTQASVRMSRQRSASGARYGSGDLVFWEHGGEATVLQSENILYSNCRVE